MSSRPRALLIGNGTYDPSESRLHPLRCPKNDVEGIASLLESDVYGPFDVQKLVDQSHNTINESIYDLLLNRAERDDLILIYYSGHGKPNSRGELHLAASDTRLRFLPLTSVSVEALSRWMQESQASQIVLILDCCYSGAFDQTLTRGEVADQLALTLPKQLSGRGTYVLTASTDTQLAEEKEGDDYGLLTKYIIRGIRTGEADLNDDGYIAMHELTLYVQREMGRDGVVQTPQGYALRIEGGELRICTSGRSAGSARIADLSRFVYEVGAKAHVPFWITRGILDIFGNDGKSGIDPARRLEYVERLYQARHNEDEFLVAMQDIVHAEKLISGGSATPITNGAEQTKEASDLTDPEFNRMLGQRSYQARDYDSAVYYLRKAAESGDSDAMYYLGIMHMEGQGVLKNIYLARQWYTRAIESEEGAPTFSKSASAMLNLGGICYELKDYAQAAKWFERSANLGDYDAIVNLGTLYRDGNGVILNHTRARELFLKAAVAGNNATAMSRLGDLYRDGLGGAVDWDEAKRWYERAAQLGKTEAIAKLEALGTAGGSTQTLYAKTFEGFLEAANAGDPEAMENVADMFRNGDGVGQNDTQAIYWFKKSAEAGNVDSMTKLGILFSAGRNVSQDYKEAGQWLQRASMAKNTTAMVALGLLLLGRLISEDNQDDSAVALIEEAAQLGDATAMHEVASWYEEGSYKTKDFSKARAWYLKASDNGDVNSMVNLGVLFCKGLGGDRDYHSGQSWFLKAAQKGDADAMINLGFLYEDGLGVLRNEEEAISWFRRAAESGNDVAQKNLERVIAKKRVGLDR